MQALEIKCGNFFLSKYGRTKLNNIFSNSFQMHFSHLNLIKVVNLIIYVDISAFLILLMNGYYLNSATASKFSFDIQIYTKLNLMQIMFLLLVLIYSQQHNNNNKRLISIIHMILQLADVVVDTMCQLQEAYISEPTLLEAQDASIW
ncbi:hypothetical protein ACJX0J_021423, partial [Zea mays]